MLTRSKDSQTDKAKRTMQDVVRYAQQVARDESLRADVSAALAHGSKASDQLKKDIQAGGIYSRLAADKSFGSTCEPCSTISMQRAIACGGRATAFATLC